MCESDFACAAKSLWRRLCRRRQPPQAAKKAHGVCRPGRDKLSGRKVTKFLPYFLCFTKSRKIDAEGGGRLPQATQKGGMAAGKEAAERQKKHTECAVPTGTNFPKGKLQSFLPYFLYFTKSRKKCRLWRQKNLILLERSRHCGELHRGLQNLDVPGKGTSCYFLRRAKSNQKACSDVQKVAGGKFLCVGDRRNRENCERT